MTSFSASLASLQGYLYNLPFSLSSSWRLFSLIVVRCNYMYIPVHKLLSLYVVSCMCIFREGHLILD